MRLPDALLAINYHTESYVPAPNWIVGFMGDEYFSSVQGVAIASVAFTDDDLAPLEVSHELRTLRLSDTQVSDAGLKRLCNLTNLAALELRRTDVTDDGLQYLKAFTKLQDLNLVDTEVTDKGLSYLPHFPELERLWIGKYDILGETEQPISDITEAGLCHIARQTNLRTLVLRNTKVTPEGIERLKRALPGLRINAGRASRANRRGNRFVEAESRSGPE
jgi:hypothetical protein